MDYSKKHEISVYLTEEQLNQRIAEIGAQITERFKRRVGLSGLYPERIYLFHNRTCKAIALPMTIDFISASSYGAQTHSSGVVNIKKDLEQSIEGENVIVVEDIVDSGNTLSRLMQLFESRNPKTLTICTLLDKPDRRVVENLQVDYTGFVIPDKFVVGFGLDYDQRYRNLPYIGFVEDAD